MPTEGAPSCSWACGWCGRQRRRKRAVRGGTGDDDDDDGAGASSLFIDLPVLEAATAGFSDGNLLGRGGFGPVYKGVLASGEEVAVKRLSLESRQGAREFLNEVRLLLKVQHRNLVSLLGCCASSPAAAGAGPGAGAGYKMLVYPYFPNGSLDHFLFGIMNYQDLVEHQPDSESLNHSELDTLMKMYVAVSRVRFRTKRISRTEYLSGSLVPVAA